ncbi:MAG: von Willebrand factor type A domain-containing protein [Bacteroidales bacterium]|nr:von Willebrand factor type A domain-containing protein [Bacteroidales bacterium]
MKTKILLLSVLALIFVQSIQAQITISGKVFDESNQPLPGVNVIEKGTTNGTITDLEGKYSLKVKDENALLVFSFIGMKTTEVNIAGKSNINVSLDNDDVGIDEVVVTGYSVQKKSCLTGSISKVNSNSFSRKNKKNRQINYSTAGNVGSSSKIRIRGTATLNNNSSSPKGFIKIQKTEQLKEAETGEESYANIDENGFKLVNTNPLSTFSVDVDRAAYSNVRRFINNGEMPPVDAVRVEEMVNYFHYDYPEPKSEHPLAIYSEISVCPWQSNHKLLHIGLQGKKIADESLPPTNFVFLIDVSGSMSSENKLPLLKDALKLLVNNLRENDRVAIVVYAGAAGEVLPSTYGFHKEKILEAIDKLQSGGSTAGGAGIKLAYKIAKENFINSSNNRVILATDGDFNVGASSDSDMEKLIEERRNDGIFLTCLGFGMGNYKDSKMETLADKGNGNYAYIDNIDEAKKTLVSEFGGTMYTIAKDVKLQVEFNPSLVKAYRLVGYENRRLNDEDFNDDTKDAGEMGAGHTVTALYEIIPVGVESEFLPKIDELKYKASNLSTKEMVNVKVRYKQPKSNNSVKFEDPVKGEQSDLNATSDNFRFSASVALFGMLLRNSKYISQGDYTTVIQLAKDSKGLDKAGYRSEFIELVNKVYGNKLARK